MNTYDEVLRPVFTYVITATRKDVAALLAELAREPFTFTDEAGARQSPWGTSFALTTVLPEEGMSIVPGFNDAETERALAASPWLREMKYGVRLWLSNSSMEYLRARPVSAQLLTAAVRLHDPNPYRD